MVAGPSGAEKSAQNGSENPRSGAAGAQNELALVNAHNQNFALTAPEPVASRRKGRHDVRHTAAYLAERGRLPAESLHLITKRSLADAVAYIRRAVPGASHTWAAEYYLRCCSELMPYTHIKQSDLEQTADTLGAAGYAAGHFLAASAMGARDAAQGRGATPSVSHNHALFDSSRPNGQPDGGRHTAMQSTNTTIDATLVELPPRGRD